MELHYRAGDRVASVRVSREGDHFRVLVDDRRHEVRVLRARGGEIELHIDGRLVRAFAAEDGAQRFVKLDGSDPFTLLRVEARRSRRRPGAHGQASLTANMHGKVAAVLVKAGDVVEPGQALVVVEAMKMELRVVAPHAGRVTGIACKVGEIVERDRVLVEIEPIEG